MSTKPETSPLEIDNVSSNFPEATDPELDIKVAGIIKTLGIEQTPAEEFLTNMESELVASIDEDALIAVEADTKNEAKSSAAIITDKETKQLKLIEKKLQLYLKTQENIKKEISQLLAIYDSNNLSPETAQQIDRLITNMRSLDDRIAFYTKKDQALRQKQQAREQQMLQINQKKKLAEKIKEQKKELGRLKVAAEQKTMASFFLAGKWLDIYRKNQQNVIAKKEQDIAKAEIQLKKLEKTLPPSTQKDQKKQLPPGTSTTSRVAPASVTSEPKTPSAIDRREPPKKDQTVPVSLRQPLPQTKLEAKRPAAVPDPKEKPREPFAELFASPVVKGTARRPDIQPAKVMQAAEQSRNAVFTKQTADIRLQEQRTKKQKSNT